MVHRGDTTATMITPMTRIAAAIAVMVESRATR
jgi:hypothetical protein